MEKKFTDRVFAEGRENRRTIKVLGVDGMPGESYDVDILVNPQDIVSTGTAISARMFNAWDEKVEANVSDVLEMHEIVKNNEQDILIQNEKVNNLVSTVDDRDINNCGTASVSINSTGQLKFSNLKGEKGIVSYRVDIEPNSLILENNIYRVTVPIQNVDLYKFLHAVLYPLSTSTKEFLENSMQKNALTRLDNKIVFYTTSKPVYTLNLLVTLIQY